MEDTGQLAAVLDLFRNHVNNLSTLAVELHPKDNGLLQLRRLIIAALNTNDLEALRLAGIRLEPHQERLFAEDDTLLETLQKESEKSQQEHLLPLIDSFRTLWPSLSVKRRARIFGDIQGILTCYMVVHKDIPPADVGLEL